MDRQFVIDGEVFTVKGEQLQYLGHQLWELERIKGMYASVILKLRSYEAYTMQQYGLGALDTLFDAIPIVV